MTRPPLYISWFDDKRGQASYYLERMRSLNVPKPIEQLIPLTSTTEFTTEARKIQSAMHNHDWNRAFVKTDCKAAMTSLKRGSFILEDSLDEIEATVESLLTQNNSHGWPHGEYLVLREWVDLNFCKQLAHSCHPEVRYFISGGEVIGHSPWNYADKTFVCSQSYSYLDGVIEDSTPPDTYAERVADEFDEATWGIDFALDTNGDWWFIEMNFNGVYWNEDHQEWMNITGQGDNEPYSPLATHHAALPDLQDQYE